MLRTWIPPHMDAEHLLTLPYRLAWGVARSLAPLLSIGDSKLARGMAGRRRAPEVLTLWGRTIRHPRWPVVWFHAPSVGEGLQAQAVIDELRKIRPELHVVFTFFSPSAEDLARRIDADVATYLPWDLRRPLAEVLEAVAPDALVFTKTEIWPTLVGEAALRGIPTGIVAATVPDGAGRRHPVARRLMAPSWQVLGFACANSEADADALRGLGVEPDVVRVSGDPGIDSAASRYDARDRRAPWLTPFRGDGVPTVVAGSTWGPDEDVLLPALGLVKERIPELRVVIAPHEPSPSTVSRLVERFESAGWRPATLESVERSTATGASISEAPGGGADAIVVERVGVLAELYEVATIAFVGGGFHDKGLHSVLEPAAAGSPVVFGPRHGNARAAGDLLAEGGAKVAVDPQTLAGVLSSWLDDEALRLASGAAAAAYIDRHRGAAGRTASLVDSLLATTR